MKTQHIAYMVADKINPELDTITLTHATVYFNINDAKEAAKGGQVLKIIIPNQEQI